MMREITSASLMFLLAVAVSLRKSFANPIVSNGAVANTANPTVHSTQGEASSDIEILALNGMTAETPAYSSSLQQMIHQLTVQGGGAKSDSSSSTIAGSIEGEQEYTTDPSIINIPNPTVKDNMIHGANILKEYILKHKNIDSSLFDEIIRDLEGAFLELPSDIGERRAEILSKLYNTQDRIKTVKSILNQAANDLKTYCNELIEIYDIKDPSTKLLLYTAKKFVKYGNRVNEILKDARNIFEKMNEELSYSKALLHDINARLKERREEMINYIEESKEQIIDNITNLKYKQVDAKNDLKYNQLIQNAVQLGICTTSELVSEYKEVKDKVCPITRLVVSEIVDPHLKAKADADHENLQRKIDKYEKDKRDINKQDKLLIKIENVQGSSSTLLSQVVDVKVYISKEIDLIKKWQNNLKKSIDDHEDISIEDIEFSIKYIKGRLIELKNACTDYLNHKLPDRLRGGAQSNISGPPVNGLVGEAQTNADAILDNADAILENLKRRIGEAQTNTAHPTVNGRSGRDGSIISRSTANESWRQDLRCGVSYSLPDGRPGQCDPGSEFPCCSDQDWCGSTYYHCSCPKCIDYGRIRNA